jgi:ketosteroid isomerase-like protein
MSTTYGAQETLTDREAIAELFNRYADALDFKRWDLLEEVYTEDATGDFPPHFRLEGRAAIIDFVRTVLGTEEIATHHMWGNLSVSVDGDTAQAAVRMRAYHGGVGRREGLFEESLGTFSGRFRRTPSGWRCCQFEEQILVMLGGAEVFELPPDMLPPGA